MVGTDLNDDVILYRIQLWAILCETYCEKENELRKFLFLGYPYYIILYGIIFLVIALLIVDTIFCSLEAES